jgi:UDP-glucose 4-epimerase
MARIFITGIAGFLGSHLADRMLALGHEVVGCDNLIGGYLDNVDARAEFYQYDLNFHNSMVKVTRGCDVVYHCAATAYEGLSVFSPFVVTKNIVTSSVSIYTAAICNGVKRIVNCSSMARYGENEVPFREEMQPKPQDPYGIGKVAAEQYLANLCNVHGVEWVNAVPHNIIGPRQKYDDPYRNVASIMINMMLQDRQPIIYGDGSQKRCFSFIQDDLGVLEKLAFEPGIGGETFNIGPDEEFVTINELARTIADLLHFDLHPTYMKGRPQEVHLANCSADKIRRRFGYGTRYSLRDGLAEMIEWIRRRGPKPFKYHLDLEIVSELTPRTWKERLF